ncbi:MAG: VWA domain-containing protein [Candidatus Woesearchaeota archaeon]|nr:VWA domain-containing protein [Nanoarchaeota archaeon]USN44299.1 MAG: VWA domain-containing protein [Candidatus Woesearchaeota archaeon]
MTFVEFIHPYLFVASVAFFLLSSLVYYFSLKRRRHKTLSINTTSLLAKVARPSAKREHSISFLFLFTLFLLLVALADPHLRLKNEKEGINVVLVMDSSGSMQAQDFDPDRMTAAKTSADLLVDQLGLKDNVGVVGFSDSTRIVSFLTNDKEKVKEKIETISAGGGTAIGDGLAMGVEMVTSIPNKKKLVILLSDGEQTSGTISIDEGIAYAKSQDVLVYTIGVGKNNQTLMGYDFFGRPQYAGLDEESLKKIALETEGEYFRAKDTIQLEDIYKELPEIIKKEKELVSIKDEVLIVSVFLFFLILLLKYKGRTRLW